MRQGRVQQRKRSAVYGSTQESGSVSRLQAAGSSPASFRTSGEDRFINAVEGREARTGRMAVENYRRKIVYRHLGKDRKVGNRYVSIEVGARILPLGEGLLCRSLRNISCLYRFLFACRRVCSRVPFRKTKAGERPSCLRFSASRTG